MNIFNQEFSFKGIHAEYVSQLTKEWDTERKYKLFDTNISLFITASVVGVLYQKRGKIDTTGSGATKIFMEQLNNYGSEIYKNYCLVMLLHEKDTVNIEERLNRAFRYPHIKKDSDEYEKLKQCLDIFTSYVLGGVEVLYEKLCEDTNELDDVLLNMYNFIDEYNKRYEQNREENMSIADLARD